MFTFAGELFVGDQAGAIHIWDLKTDHNEQRIPDPEASIQSIAVDSEGKTMAAVNNKVMRESKGKGPTGIDKDGF